MYSQITLYDKTMCAPDHHAHIWFLKLLPQSWKLYAIVDFIILHVPLCTKIAS